MGVNEQGSPVLADVGVLCWSWMSVAVGQDYTKTCGGMWGGYVMCLRIHISICCHSSCLCIRLAVACFCMTAFMHICVWTQTRNARESALLCMLAACVCAFPR